MARLFVEANVQRLDGSFAQISAPLTMACWFYDEGGAITDNDVCMLQIQDASDASNYFRLGHSDVDHPAHNHVMVSVNSGATFQVAVTSTSYSLDAWHHAVGVIRTSTDREVWLDGGGNVLDTVASGAPANIDSITIGREGDSTPGDEWNGALAEVAVWDAELTQAEISALAMGYSPSMIQPWNLVFYAPLIKGNASGDDKAIWTPNSGVLTSVATTGQVGDFPHPAIIYPHNQRIAFPAAVGLTQDQDQFRFYNDDGTEALATAIAVQNVNISQAGTVPAILRIQVNNTGDAPSQQMKLQYKITTQPDSEYRDVPVA